MRRPRLFITAALSVGVLGLATTAVPATAATGASASDGTLPVATATTAKDTAPVSPQYTVQASVYGYSATCYSGGGAVWSVFYNGINIRNAPDGTAEYGISKNRWWDDNFTISGYSGTFDCTSNSTPGNQYWRPGFANYNTALEGWVGADYLNYVEPY
jgi:hypothetical protein